MKNYILVNGNCNMSFWPIREQLKVGEKKNANAELLL